MEHALALMCYIFCLWNVLWRFCVIFSVCGTRSGVIVCYFPHVKGARVERDLMSLFLHFFACGTRSSVIVLHFPRVERALALLC